MIETERLLLRRIVEADADEFVSIHKHPTVTRFMGTFDRDEALRWIERNDRDWDQLGYGRLAIVENATGRLLGRSGLKYWPQFEETEVGWLLRPDAWGRGFATEAGRASIEWGIQELGLPRITAMIMPENQRSIRVAERLGMEPSRGDVLLGEPVIVYSTDR
jgi:RimJ/RimL family protein N-acetyltransferase